MKKLVLLSVLFGALPISMMAQDDLYFTPKKSDKTVKSTPKVESEAPAYYSGSNRNVDEYNRRGKFGSYFEKIGTDSLGNDIIEFHSSADSIADTLSVYPGTKVQYDVDDDYYYSRRMSRFDDFYWYDPWFRGPYYGWHSPWWYSRWGWYDPWYYGYAYNGWFGWYDWYDPYYYSWYGWGSPYHWGWYGGWNYYRPVYVTTNSYRTHSGTRDLGYGGRGYGNVSRNTRTANHNRGFGHSRVGGYRGNSSGVSSSSRSSGYRGVAPSTNSGSFGGSSSGGSRGGGFSGGGSSSGGSRGGGFSGGGGSRAGGRR